MSEVQIVPVSPQLVGGLNAAIDVVARERRYIGLLKAPPLEATRALMQRILDGGGVQLLAVTPTGAVVGWCDIVRSVNEGFRHLGRLGMGLLPDYRGRGLGKSLATQTIAAAVDSGIERIELEVFASNAPAIALYRTLGFTTEGIRRGARRLDGVSDDLVCMALLDVERR